jgi:hypothetical protein
MPITVLVAEDHQLVVGANGAIHCLRRGGAVQRAERSIAADEADVARALSVHRAHPPTSGVCNMQGYCKP